MEGDRRRSPEGNRRLRLFSCPLEAAIITSMIGKSILAEKNQQSFHDTGDFRLCGGDKGAMKTGEACGRPLDPFAGRLPCSLNFSVTFYG